MAYIDQVRVCIPHARAQASHHICCCCCPPHTQRGSIRYLIALTRSIHSVGGCGSTSESQRRLYEAFPSVRLMPPNLWCVSQSQANEISICLLLLLQCRDPVQINVSLVTACSTLFLRCLLAHACLLDSPPALQISLFSNPACLLCLFVSCQDRMDPLQKSHHLLSVER